MHLDLLVSDLPHIGPSYERKLAKLGINTIRDLLYYVPARYLDFSKTTPLSQISIGDTITAKGKLTFLKNQYTKSGKKIQIGEIEDVTGSVPVIWFNQPFLTRIIFPGETLSLSGKIDWFGREKAFISPEYEKGVSSLHTGRLVPIYPETAGLSSKWLRVRINEASHLLKSEIHESLPEDIINNYHIMGLKEAIVAIHFPKTISEAEKGRKRFAFEELLHLHLGSMTRKADWRNNKAVAKLPIDKKTLSDFILSFPFDLTSAQKRSVNEMLKDLSMGIPMNRLLEGDVGSGKTVVAATGVLASFLNGYQSIIMAPTQILANQHYETLKEVFSGYKLRISLLTSAGRKADPGKSDLIIGTHTLIYKKASFDKVAFVVIDELHKFGVKQRNTLIKMTKRGKKLPHILTMTATPIPRTVALTFYGDMDLSVLDEMPKERIKPVTWLIPPEKRALAYQWIDEKIVAEKTQAFVICPLIDESESDLLLNIKAVISEHIKLKKVFKKRSVGLLHGRLKNDDKNKVIADFKSKKYDLLVSTPVVEVGIDIPNANLMIIEGAERFGLAQLHQLRGRVGRGDVKSYCLLFTESSSEKVFSRLDALKKAKSGFELAELDLKLRGPGEIFGTRQHGFPEMKVASWQDIDLIKSSKEAALELFGKIEVK